MALPPVTRRFPGIPGPEAGCLGLGLGLRKRMSSIVFLVLGQRGSSTCEGEGRGGGVVASVFIGEPDSLMAVVGCFETAPVLGLSDMVARECWDISNPHPRNGRVAW